MEVTKTPKRRRNARQTTIKGTGFIDEIDQLADQYKDRLRERQAVLAQEVELKAALYKAMKEHKLKSYTTADNLLVTVVPAGDETIKVKAAPKRDE